MSKSRQQEDLDNHGQYMLADDRNHIVLGDKYDATLDEIEAYLKDVPVLEKWERS